MARRIFSLENMQGASLFTKGPILKNLSSYGLKEPTPRRVDDYTGINSEKSDSFL